jgi:formamidopyrimidine-DNA glycosylase
LPELPDVVLYIEALKTRIVGQRLEHLHLLSPFVLRSVEPPIESIVGLTVRDILRSGKRIVFLFDPSTRSGSSRPSAGSGGPELVEGRAESKDEEDLFLVLHLMIAGRLRWREPNQKAGIGPKLLLASLVMSNGTLFFTEASSRKRASMQLVRGRAALAALERGGIEPLEATDDAFREALMRENHTLKRGLTDPRLFSGIGNAYSDEILHAARLSPLKLTRSLSDEEVKRLYAATRDTLLLWIDRLRQDLAGRFPEKVTAFHDRMAVHGRFKQPCPVCGTRVQRIVYAANECNYCAKCQTGGRLLADRSLSRLLRDDWPKSIDDI